MAKEKKPTSARRGMTMAEAHARVGEIQPKARIEHKVSGMAVPASGKPGGKKGGR